MNTLITILLLSTTLFANINVYSAWQNVLNNNNGLKASKGDIRHAILKKESAEGMYLPSVSISGSYTHLNDPIGIDISDVSKRLNPIISALGGKAIPSEVDLLGQDIALVDLNLLYPLYTGGKIDAAQDAYSAQVSEVKAKYNMAKDKSFLELIKLYYGVVMTNALHKTRIESEKSLQLHYKHAQKLREQGQISRVELLNSKVKLDIAKIETIKAKHKVDIVASAFYKIIKSKNRPKTPLFVLHQVGAEHKYSEQSINKHSAIDVLNAKSKQAKALVDIEKSAWHPEVLGYASMNLHRGDSPMEEMSPNWMVGVGVKFNIFSRKDRAKEIEAAKILHAKVALLKAQTREDLSLAVQKTYDEMVLYRDEFESLSSSLALARENYKLRSLAFKEGLSTTTEVVDAQVLLSGAKTKRLNAAYNYVNKLAMLCVLSGDRELFFKFEKSSKGIK